MDLTEIEVNARNWVGSAQERNNWRAFVNTASNLRLPYPLEFVGLLLIYIYQCPRHLFLDPHSFKLISRAV